MALSVFRSTCKQFCFCPVLTVGIQQPWNLFLKTTFVLIQWLSIFCDNHDTSWVKSWHSWKWHDRRGVTLDSFGNPLQYLQSLANILRPKSYWTNLHNYDATDLFFIIWWKQLNKPLIQDVYFWTCNYFKDTWLEWKGRVFWTSYAIWTQRHLYSLPFTLDARAIQKIQNQY